MTITEPIIGVSGANLDHLLRESFRQSSGTPVIRERWSVDGRMFVTMTDGSVTLDAANDAALATARDHSGSVEKAPSGYQGRTEWCPSHGFHHPLTEAEEHERDRADQSLSLCMVAERTGRWDLVEGRPSLDDRILLDEDFGGFSAGGPGRL